MGSARPPATKWQPRPGARCAPRPRAGEKEGGREGGRNGGGRRAARPGPRPLRPASLRFSAPLPLRSRGPLGERRRPPGSAHLRPPRPARRRLPPLRPEKETRRPGPARPRQRSSAASLLPPPHARARRRRHPAGRAPLAPARAPPAPALGVRRWPISARSRAPPPQLPPLPSPTHTPRRAPPLLPPRPRSRAAQCCPPPTRPGPAPLPPAARPGPARPAHMAACGPAPSAAALAPQARPVPRLTCGPHRTQPPRGAYGRVSGPRAPTKWRRSDPAGTEPGSAPRAAPAIVRRPLPSPAPHRSPAHRRARPRPRGTGGRVLVGPRRAAFPPVPPPALGRPSPHTGGVPRAVVAAAPSLPPAEAGGSATSRAGPGAAPRHRTARHGSARRGAGGSGRGQRGAVAHTGAVLPGPRAAAAGLGAVRRWPPPRPRRCPLFPDRAGAAGPLGAALPSRGRGARYGRASRPPTVTAGGHGGIAARRSPAPRRAPPRAPLPGGTALRPDGTTSAGPEVPRRRLRVDAPPP